MKHYDFIKWNPGFSRARFGTAKGQGLRQTSFETVRIRLDGKEALISYPAGQRPAEIKPADINLGGLTKEQAFAHIQANIAAWEDLRPFDAQPVVAPVQFRADVVDPEVAHNKLLKWLAAAAVAGGIGYGLYTLKGNSREEPVSPAPVSVPHGSGQ